MRFLLLPALVLGLAACDAAGPDDPASSYATAEPAATADARADGFTGRALTATLTGEAEVGPGDLDGSGSALVRLNSGQEQVCFDVDVEDIGAPTRIHIHEAPAGVNGPVVVTFFDLVVNPDAEVPADLRGCVSADRDLVKEIRKTPSDYYVNVHTAEFPAGALRGQLSK